MKKIISASIFLWLFSFISVSAHDPELHRVITSSKNIPSAPGYGFEIGKSLDLRKWSDFNLIEKERDVFSLVESKNVESRKSQRWQFINSNSTESEIHRLHVSLEASYGGLGDATASFNRRKSIFKENRAIAGLLITDSHVVNINNDKFLLDYDQVEKFSDTEEEFFRTFGTHYVSSIAYGSILAIEASLSNEESYDEEKLRASLNIAIGAFKAKSSLSQSEISKLENLKLQITASIVGSVSSNGPDCSAQAYVMKSLGEFSDFLEKYASGCIIIKPTIISVIAKSYRDILDPDNTPKAYQIIHRNRSLPSSMAPIENGIPSGAILAWMPEHENLEPPEGWVICDGRKIGDLSVPDLRGRFIVGADSENGTKYYGESYGGNREHIHVGTTGPLSGGGDHDSGGRAPSRLVRHKHSINTPPITALPPWHSVAFICKI